MKRLVKVEKVGANSDVISVTSASTFRISVSDLTFVGRSAATTTISTGTDASGVSLRRKYVKAMERRQAKSYKSKWLRDPGPLRDSAIFVICNSTSKK